MLDFTDSYVVVIGGKRSGQAAAELLQNEGAFVRAMDSQELSEEDQAAFDELEVEVVEQSEANLTFEGREPDFIVISPGVPFDLPHACNGARTGSAHYWRGGTGVLYSARFHHRHHRF